MQQEPSAGGLETDTEGAFMCPLHISSNDLEANIAFSKTVMSLNYETIGVISSKRIWNYLYNLLIIIHF